MKEVKTSSIGNKLNLQRNLETLYEILHKIQNIRCKQAIEEVIHGLINKEKWALQIFDSIPKFPSGFLSGNMYHLGNFQECISTRQVNQTEDDSVHIKGQYCLANVTLKLQQNELEFIEAFHNKESKENPRGSFDTNLIYWGICMPLTCTHEDAEIFVEEIFSSLIHFNHLNVSIRENDCYYEEAMIISTGHIVYGSIVAIYILFVAVSTILHMRHIQKRKKLVSYNIENLRYGQSTFLDVIQSFSLIQTIKKILYTKPTEINLECICGIKVLSMIFILGGHSLLFIFGSPVENTDFANEMYSIENSLYLNSPLLVDTFLLVSGFLMCRLLLMELDKRNGQLNFLLLYIARYIRLTPAYVIIIGFNLTWLPDIGSGPFWKSVIGLENQRCKTSWWTNLLYINNYVNTDNLCMFQSWFLAVDFHMFLIAPFFIFILWKWRKTGISLILLATIFTVILPGYIIFINDLDPTFLAFPPETQDISSNYYFVNAYIKTHMRANSYFFGLIFGYLVYQLQMNCVKFSDFVKFLGWVLATILGVTSMCSIVLFLSSGYVTDSLQSAIYGTLHRIAWVLSVGWVILVCVTDNAGWVNKLLSWKVLIVLSRLTYCIYLVNGTVLLCYKGMVRNVVSWTKLQLVKLIILS
ncbi:hypothetical protein ABEB36_005235 [Hypothenemus hampei]|uniref:Nose resistant-to-fluoxetine protein N-terminal domain-containing protein n=1 Tax=Hypothenemus hampei TaxID=57062 RepID=A0ABD1EXH3_HYPHA